MHMRHIQTPQQNSPNGQYAQIQQARANANARARVQTTSAELIMPVAEWEGRDRPPQRRPQKDVLPEERQEASPAPVAPEAKKAQVEAFRAEEELFGLLDAAGGKSAGAQIAKLHARQDASSEPSLDQLLAGAVGDKLSLAPR